ncbi:GGDEF domain-containing protein [Massilia sp. KIM]|uniref:GGDEF domain-containing protein n=1 Tax=Massilia sp. KIM TaxID=1955422 RepID=UPI00098FBCC5|nr:GGDEF domain-containing protein [Massilia sp. KIM]OON59332.1 GGDEF domain-containing protein [Massilia sp. KIM]
MKIHPLTGEFAGPAVESAFLEHKLASTRALLGFTLLFCTFFFLSFFATDIAALGVEAAVAATFPARLLVAVTAGACAWLAYRRPLSVRATRIAATLAESVALASFMHIAVQRPHEFHWHAMSLAIMLVVIYLYIPNRLIYAILLATAATAAFLGLVLALAPMPFRDMLTMGMLLVLVNTFGALAARRFNQVSREEFQLQSHLKTIAERDHLTGCYNRRYLHEHLLEAELTRARRLGHPLTVVLCDIDNFKLINDNFGHEKGDDVIRAFASLLERLTRDNVDSVVRYGGEEFLLILPGTSLEGGERLAERLREAFAATPPVLEPNPFGLRTTASFGVASFDYANQAVRYSVPDLISAADKLMYEAKRKGRNRVESIELR